MTDHTVNVAALIGSRICHDLISPVGAVTNGLELLAMSGVADSPELQLVNHSAADASARIKLFRLAFGAASAEQKTSSEELCGILSNLHSDGRITFRWNAAASMPRRVAKAVTLAILCVEQSLPFGGVITVGTDGDALNVTGSGKRTRERLQQWSGLTGDAPLVDIPPADVQFLLLRDLLRDLDRHCTVSHDETRVCLRF